ncbi:MAG: cytochrome c oxidase assembly protein [Micrococcaceae bacterium]
MRKQIKWYLPLSIFIGIIALLVGLHVTNAQESLLLNDNVKYVATFVPLATFINNIAAATTIGSLVAAATIFSQRERTLRIASIASVIWGAAAIAVFLLTYVEVSNQALNRNSTSGLGDFLFNIATGQAWGVIILIAVSCSTLILLIKGQASLFFVTLLSICGLIPQALIGHASGSSNHTLAVNGLGLHILGVSLWLGGLIALFFNINTLENPRVILQRFSALAFFSYLLVLGSGIVSTIVRVGNFKSMLTPYGSIIIAKIIATILLGVAGFFQRKLIVAHTTADNTKKQAYKLIAVELCILGAASGLAAALAASPPPVPQQLRPEATPAEILTGQLLPPPLTTAQWFLQWKVDVLWLTIGLVMIVTYLRGYFKIIRRGDKWPVYRPISWIIGWLLLFFFVSAGTAVYGQFLFSAHMVEHMALTMTVPICLVLGAPITLLLKSTVPRKDGSWGPREWILWLVQSPYARIVSNPIFAAANFVLSIIIFYYTPLFGLALRTHIGHELMITHFILTGYFFVQSMIGIDPVHKRLSYPMRIIVLMATMAFHAFFGVALMNTTNLLQASWFGNMGRTWGNPPLQDQHIGGAVAWGVGEIPTLLLALLVTVSWVQADKKETKRLDRAADRDHDAELKAYNEMLKDMNTSSQ